MASDVNKTFGSLAWIFILGGVAATFQSGLVPLLGALFICYVMLVATNAINRGEKQVRKQ
jgi:hypothetical protein